MPTRCGGSPSPKPNPHAARTYRVICRIDDEARAVTVVDIGHRRDVYRA
jgi:mRNA interferase RelE/StbE